ncbi:MAG: hypothetical protein IT258_18005 [Saprospiraceae bacterium]|nr:hypothetical protein [Saprospiraceae bacterium]
MKKIFERIRTKERDEKNYPNNKKTDIKEEKTPAQLQAQSLPNQQQPNDLFWDDYSDVGYC